MDAGKTAALAVLLTVVLLAPAARSASTHGPRTCDPGPVREAAARWAGVFRVPAEWLTSLAWVESRFCPGAENESGATGVAQVKLSRATDLVRWLGRSRWAGHPAVLAALASWRGLREDLRDLTLCLGLAAYDLRRLRGKFREHDLVMAAYNQGESTVSRCLAGGCPLPERAREFVARVWRARELGHV